MYSKMVLVCPATCIKCPEALTLNIQCIKGSPSRCLIDALGAYPRQSGAIYGINGHRSMQLNIVPLIQDYNGYKARLLVEKRPLAVYARIIV